jgi:hypothetical protein
VGGDITWRVSSNRTTLGGHTVTVWEGITREAEVVKHWLTPLVHVTVVMPSNVVSVDVTLDGPPALLLAAVRTSIDAIDANDDKDGKDGKDGKSGKSGKDGMDGKGGNAWEEKDAPTVDEVPAAVTAAVTTAAMADYDAGMAAGSELLYSEHRAAWETLWESGLEVKGRPDVAAVVNSSLYYLLSSVREDRAHSLSPGGLASNGCVYELMMRRRRMMRRRKRRRKRRRRMMKMKDDMCVTCVYYECSLSHSSMYVGLLISSPLPPPPSSLLSVTMATPSGTARPGCSPP